MYIGRVVNVSIGVMLETLSPCEKMLRKASLFLFIFQLKQLKAGLRLYFDYRPRFLSPLRWFQTEYLYL